MEVPFCHVWSCDVKRSHSIVKTLANVGDSCLAKFVNGFRSWFLSYRTLDAFFIQIYVIYHTQDGQIPRLVSQRNFLALFDCTFGHTYQWEIIPVMLWYTGVLWYTVLLRTCCTLLHAVVCNTILHRAGLGHMWWSKFDELPFLAVFITHQLVRK